MCKIDPVNFHGILGGRADVATDVVAGVVGATSRHPPADGGQVYLHK
jgi:hypothetical protein